MRLATPDDVDLLVELMSEFYAEAAFTLNRARSAEAFARLLWDDRLGRVWLVEADGDVVGYLAVTFGFSLEYGGLDAVVDDFFIRAPYRGRGVGTEALTTVRDYCSAMGVGSDR